MCVLQRDWHGEQALELEKGAARGKSNRIPNPIILEKAAPRSEGGGCNVKSKEPALVEEELKRRIGT